MFHLDVHDHLLKAFQEDMFSLTFVLLGCSDDFFLEPRWDFPRVTEIVNKKVTDR